MILFHNRWKKNQERPPRSANEIEPLWTAMTTYFLILILAVIVFTTDWHKSPRPCCPGRMSCGCSE